LKNQKKSKEPTPTPLTKFAADIRVAMDLPSSILERRDHGYYLRITESDQAGEVQEIVLWHGFGNEQAPVIALRYRPGENDFMAVTSIERPIEPARAILASIFATKQQRAVSREQALTIIYTMMLYLKVRG
jgi:hypothetical protein